MKGFYLHPQPTSVTPALKAALKAGVRGEVVLDPFCGTGSLVLAAIKAGADRAIGSDIEDWSFALRPELERILSSRTLNGRRKVELHWGLDARKAVRRFDHTVLFTDPPDPHDVIGGHKFSMLRELRKTGRFRTGADIRRYWKERFDERNLIGKKKRTIDYVIRLIREELQAGRRVIFHAYSKVWARGCRFDWQRELTRHGLEYELLEPPYVEVLPL